MLNPSLFRTTFLLKFRALLRESLKSGYHYGLRFPALSKSPVMVARHAELSIVISKALRRARVRLTYESSGLALHEGR